MAALYYLAPQFLYEGRLCWLRAPLYIVKSGKVEHYYYSDEEYAASKVKGEVSRAKGLGSLSPNQAHDSMFGANQRLDVLEPDEDSLDLLMRLMGKDVAPRAEFIFSQIDFSQIHE